MNIPSSHALAGAAFALAAATQTMAADSYKFDFGAGPGAPGYTRIAEAIPYTRSTGYGFENPAGITFANGQSPDALRGDFCTSTSPFAFSVALPEGNYNVSLVLGDPAGESVTTVKAESRRLMLEKVATARGKFETVKFTVNIRTPQIGSAGKVSLKPREPEVLNWDDKLTIEFSNTRPCLCAMEITKADDAITVYIAGDSTVTDQPNEPWSSWGAMLPRFFKPGVAVSNHSWSGLSLRSFMGGKRLDKILSTMKQGDYLFIQFGHNDQKEKGEGVGAFTTYKADLEHFVEEARKKGGLPVLVTSMQRRRFDGAGKVVETLGDYPEAVRQVATEKKVPLIDLNAMSRPFYEALGPENSKKAFVHYPAGTFPGQTAVLKDDTHFNTYGGYELAKCIVEGIKANVPDLAKHLVDNLPSFDPSHPDPVDKWNLPASAAFEIAKPDGS